MPTATESVHDPLREAKEIREQLGSSNRRLTFFFGAGTSQAAGIDGVMPLTKKITDVLSPELKKHYKRLLAEGGTSVTVENVLDTIRLCRELIGDSKTNEVHGLKGDEAANLDRAVCLAIYKAVSIAPPKGLKAHVGFAQWVRSIDRDFPVEIFTTNYDLLIERGLEEAETPHFDGFVGTVEPYFSSTAVESDHRGRHAPMCAPKSWVRVWKIHGSIGWRARLMASSGCKRIVRTPLLEPGTGEDMMIFPSRQKYADSRKQPYIAYLDRLRQLLCHGETLLVIAGYSFSDEHINEVIFEGLRNNNRLAVTAFMYEPLASEHLQDRLVKHAIALRNLTVYGPDAAVVSGVRGKWMPPTDVAPKWLGEWPFLSTGDAKFCLGDFSGFVQFLQVFIGKRDPVTVAPDKSPVPAVAATT